MKTQFTFVLIIVLITGLTVNGQNTFPVTGATGIGTTEPHSSALLEIKSANKGLLIPRMNKSERDAIVTPATGLMIYQTNFSPGFYFFNGRGWQTIEGANKTLSNLTAPTRINANLLPDSNLRRELGSPDLKWNYAYVNNLVFNGGDVQTSAFVPYNAGAGISINGTVISATGTASQWTTNNNGIYYNNGNAGIGTSAPLLGGLVVDRKVGAVNAVFGSNTSGISIESNSPGLGFNSYLNESRKFMKAGYANYIGTNPASGFFSFQASSAFGGAGSAASMKEVMALARDGSLRVYGADAGLVLTDRVQTNYGGFNWYAKGGKARLFRYNYGGELLTIDSLGHMGIGNINPTLAGLIVDKKAGAVNAIFGSNTSGVSIESDWPGLGLNSFFNGGRKLISSGYANYIGANPADGTFYLQASSAASSALSLMTMNNIMTINRQGGVYITGSDAGYVFGDRVQNNYAGFNWYASGGKARLYRYNYGGDLLTIDSLGRMGIGNTNPTLGALVVDTKMGATHAVFGSNTTGVSIESNYPGVSLNGYYNGGRKSIKAGYVGGISMDPTSGLITIYNSTDRALAGNALLPISNNLFINRSGNVGIGAEATTYKLEVCGTIRANEIIVQTGWCDYVFDKKYPLRPLHDVENFISQNKHLPDVPSAAVVESQGIKLAEMDSILIKKVEELTLYIIQQNKQMEQLQQKVTQLENPAADNKNRK